MLSASATEMWCRRAILRWAFATFGFVAALEPLAAAQERPSSVAPAAPSADPATAAATPASQPAPVGRPAASPADAWQFAPYGFVEFDVFHDTTQSYAGGSNNTILQRPGTFAGDHGRTQFTVNNSQLGLRIAAPEFQRIRASGRAEVDFFGGQPTDVTEINVYTAPTTRLRLFYLRLDTPYFDVIAGQYHGPFGWGLQGFFPNTIAFLGIPGQLFHREPQLRISKTVKGRIFTFDAAIAALRPPQRDSQFPDLQAGMALALNTWTGANAQGFGQPGVTPLSLGVSGIGRRFAVTDFVTFPQDTNKVNGWGLAADAFIPVIPARSAGERNNALSLVGEFAIGTGISDQYTSLTGGSRFPTLVNPGNLFPPPIFQPNIDTGIVTYDANLELQTIDWRSFFVGLQYYLPIDSGRIWISGNYSRLDSDNIRELTPELDHGAIIDHIEYFDGNVHFALTPAVQLGVSFQRTKQRFGDGVKHQNDRGEFAFRFFF